MKKRIALNWKPISAVGMVVLMMLTLLGFAGGTVGAQDAPSRTISVSGSGQVYGTPDIAYVGLGVDISDPDISKALENANQAMIAITKGIGDVGVDAKDIQTVSFSVYSENLYDPQSGQPTGKIIYHVQDSVNVAVRDISKIGAVLQAGLNAGANSVSGPNFGIADMKGLESQARLAAVADAHDRAQQLADAFGVKLGDVISVSESISNPVPPVFARADVVAASAPSPQISAGQLSVSIDVSVTYSIAG